jgi:chitinase
MTMTFGFLIRILRAEIQNVISTTGVTPTWDKTAAVKYIVWNGDQWVSYDDADTFKQVK